MKESRTSIIMKEYYDITAPLLFFSAHEKGKEIERQVLQLLCESRGCKERIEEYWTMIESARCLQSWTDSALLQSTDAPQSNIAYDIKADALTVNKIGKLRSFDESTFVEGLKTKANTGDKNSCKLLALLYWLGLLIPQNKETAQTIWSLLAMGGDRLALEMLIYGYTDMGDVAARTRWSNIRHILQQEFEAFSPVALYSTYPDYSEEEVQTANIIMFIAQREGDKELLNRPMLYYALTSKDDYIAKMNNLSAQTNYYLALHDEDKHSKRIGF